MGRNELSIKNPPQTPPLVSSVNLLAWTRPTCRLLRAHIFNYRAFSLCYAGSASHSQVHPGRRPSGGSAICLRSHALGRLGCLFSLDWCYGGGFFCRPEDFRHNLVRKICGYLEHHPQNERAEGGEIFKEFSFDGDLKAPATVYWHQQR